MISYKNVKLSDIPKSIYIDEYDIIGKYVNDGIIIYKDNYIKITQIEECKK